VVDTGSHDELLERCPTYAALVRDRRSLGAGDDPTAAGAVP
jgi:hypothetical protein